MKKMVVLLLTVLSTIIFSTTILIYSESVIIAEKCEVKGTKEITYPEGLRVMDVLHADEWFIVPGKRESWYEIMKNKKVKIVKELDGLEGEVISLDPLVLKAENKAYLWNKIDKRWYIFEYETPVSTPDTLVVKAEKTVEILYTTKGSWNVVYDMWEYGYFTARVTLPVIPVDEGNVFLISGFFKKRDIREIFTVKRSAFIEEKEKGIEPMGIEEPMEIEEAKVYSLGYLKGLSKGLGVSFGAGKIKKIENIYGFSFPVSSGSFGYRKTSFNKVAKNTKENGLGFPIPSGVVRFHKKIDNQDVIVSLGYVKDVPVGGDIVFSLGDSWDVRIKGELLKYEKYRTYAERVWKITIMNTKKEPVKVRIVVLGESLKLLNSSIECEKKADQLVFNLVVKPGEAYFDFKVQSRW